MIEKTLRSDSVLYDLILFSSTQFMSPLFEELDYRITSIGAISLRRRHILKLKRDIYEIILGDEHLMSDLFTASEIALARLGIEAAPGDNLDVVIGGLGLGYTAQAALESSRVKSLMVVDYLDAVIGWHNDNLVPLDPPLGTDKRCVLVHADFFERAASDAGFDTDHPGRTFHAILIDIDHSPDWLLDSRSGSFYSVQGLEKLTRHLKPGGVMGLWSDAAIDEAFLSRIAQVFETARAEPVTFDNPLQPGKTITQTVYLGILAS